MFLNFKPSKRGCLSEKSVKCIGSSLLEQWESYTVQHVSLAALTNTITRACRSSDVWCSSAGVIINVLLSWQASRRANAIIQQCLALGYLAWMVTKWEMFGHGWTVGFVYCVSWGQLDAPVKRGIWRVLFHLATCHHLIHNVPCRPFYYPSRSCAHKQTSTHKLAYAQRHA